MSEQVIRPEGIPSEEAFGRFKIVLRGYLSAQHLWAAEHFTRLAAEYEAVHDGESQLWIPQRSYVLGAVGESVAFLEAFINEVFQDAKDATDGVTGAQATQGLSGDVVRLMAAYWTSTNEGERVRALDKYDAARLFAGCPRQDRGRLPDQDVPRVIALRNWSVHYRHRATATTSPTCAPRSRTPARAKTNPKTRSWQARTTRGFPTRPSAPGCARWAAQTVRAFVDQFVTATGCRADYQIPGLLGEQP
jgi:hypothetical protein